MPVFADLRCYKKLATHVAVGMGAASFWRGFWYVLDDNLFPENREVSAACSLGLGVMGMAASQGLVARAEQIVSSSPLTLWGRLGPSAARFGAIYSVAASVVLVWRGTWVGWDCLYERFVNQDLTEAHKAVKSTDPEHATKSGVLSHVVAMSLLLGAGLFTSVLAPPAAVSVIRDVTVKGASTYQGPAQVVMDQFLFGRIGSGTMAAGSSRGMSATRKVVSRTPPMMEQRYRRFQRFAFEKQTFSRKDFEWRK